VSSCRGINRGQASEERITTTQPPEVTETRVIQPVVMTIAETTPTIPLVVMTIAETTPTIPLVVITSAETTTLVEHAVQLNIPTSVERTETADVPPASTNARDYEILSPEIPNVQAEALMRKSKIVINKRRRQEEMRRMIEEQEVEQKRVRDERRAVRQGYDETIRLIKENQVSREAEMRREVEAIAAAARAGSILCTAAPSVIGETGTYGGHDTGDALTDRALMMPRDKTTREHTSSPAVSSIEKAPSEKPDSLNFSSSFSRRVNEVDCRLFKECGCDAYAMDSDNREYFRGLRARRESEAKMLDADLRSKRIGNLGETGVTEPKVSPDAQKQQGDEEEV
jgi:hypothetical protein